MRKTKKTIEKSKKQNSVETIEGLRALLDEYQKKVIQLDFRVSRLHDILSRKSIVKLSNSKFEKMKRQLSEAKEDRDFSKLALDQISFRISQIS